MIIYPSIDIKDGKVVRLQRGDMERATVFNDDPADQARQFAAQGFAWIHVVDLNGAFAGEPKNIRSVEKIIKATPLPVQLGGGIRDMKRIEDWLSHGVARVVLGTAAVKQPELVRAACQKFPGKIAVALDARDGIVAVSGWAETSGLPVLDLALRFEDCGVAAIIYTDVNRDGLLGGVNVDATVDLAYALTTPVIASGGVSSLDDLLELKAQEKAGLNGVIVGRALYDGRIDPAQALAKLT